MKTDNGATYAQIPSALLRHKALSGNSKLLYALLWDYADRKTRTATVSRQTLADDMDRSKDTIDRARKELEAVNALEVIAQYTSNGDRASSRWRLLPWERIIETQGGGRTHAEGVAAGEGDVTTSPPIDTWDAPQPGKDDGSKITRDGAAASSFKSPSQASHDEKSIASDSHERSFSKKDYWDRKKGAKETTVKFKPSDNKPMTQNQRVMLLDVLLLLDGTDQQGIDETIKSIGSALEAHESIQEYWGLIEHEGRDSVATRAIANPNVYAQLSPNSRAWVNKPQSNWRNR